MRAYDRVRPARDASLLTAPGNVESKFSLLSAHLNTDDDSNAGKDGHGTYMHARFSMMPGFTRIMMIVWS
jgi:hypothetical protein